MYDNKIQEVIQPKVTEIQGKLRHSSLSVHAYLNQEKVCDRVLFLSNLEIN